MQYIVGVEKACKNLHPGVADVMRAEIMEILDSAKKPISNLTKEEKKAIKELEEDQSLIIVRLQTKENV